MLGLQSGKKTPCGKICSGDYCKVHSERTVVINQFLLPLGCVEKGFKVQFKFAMLVVEKKKK